VFLLVVVCYSDSPRVEEVATEMKMDKFYLMAKTAGDL